MITYDDSNLILLESDETKYLKKQSAFTKPSTSDPSIGICCMVSLFNACPRIFSYETKTLEKCLNDLKLNDSYRDIDSVIEYFNNLFYIAMESEILLKKHKIEDLNKKDMIIKDSINSGIPIVYYVNYLNQRLGSGHAITILGYDQTNYYAFENTSDNKNPILNDIIISQIMILLQKPLDQCKDQNIYDLVKQIKESKQNHDQFVSLCDQLHKMLESKCTIFTDYDGKFFKFNKQLLYKWYETSNIGIVEINKKIKTLDLSNIAFAHQFSDLVFTYIDYNQKAYDYLFSELQLDMNIKEHFVKRLFVEGLHHKIKSQKELDHYVKLIY